MWTESERWQKKLCEEIEKIGEIFLGSEGFYLTLALHEQASKYLNLLIQSFLATVSC
jgi:hypothetical protein